MDFQLLHIFRNTPLGRETLFQSIYFCKQVGVVPVIYIPEFTKFLMYFENDVVQIDLDNSYLTAPDTAVEHVNQIVDQMGVNSTFLKAKHFTATTLPDIPTNFDFMCCPRSISDLSSKIGLGYI
ncbi:MAG: universal stress protein, partial [Deltaproteobacteria bacterium]|nr:universal stress protein [Deltaproteobacteria bacterium]